MTTFKKKDRRNDIEKNKRKKQSKDRHAYNTTYIKKETTDKRRHKRKNGRTTK